MLEAGRRLVVPEQLSFVDGLSETQYSLQWDSTAMKKS